MAFGQIRSSSGRTLNLSPQGWINDQGENLNQAPLGNALSQAVSGQQMPQQSPQQGNRLAQLAQGPMPLSDFFDATGTSMKGRVDMNGKDAYMTPDGQVVWQNPDGSIGRTVPEGTRKLQMAAEDRQRKIAGENADLAYRQAQTQSLAQGKQATVPAGYRPTADGNMEPIPGGPADLKAQGRFNQDVASQSATDAALTSLAEEANSVAKHKGLDAATGWQTLFPTMPGSKAADATAQLDTLKSKTAFGTLQAMRDASKTGGALGAVSEKELKLLESNLAALDTAQSPEQFRESLAKIVKFTEEAKGRSRNAFNLTHGDKQPSQAQPANGFADPSKEQRYQEWKKANGR